MTNFYNILNVDASASTEEIQAAIKKERRVWNNRSTNPDADIRAEAEKMVHDIADAETILLDSNKRANYDMELAQSVVEESEPETKGTPHKPDYSDGKWCDLADQYRESGDWIAVISLMQEVIKTEQNDALAWHMLGYAYYQVDNYLDAEQCLNKSLQLSPDDMCYESLGLVYNYTKQYDKALPCFEEASRLTTNVDHRTQYQFECAEALRMLKQYAKALDVAEEAYKQDPNAKNGQAEYFACLRDRIYIDLSYNMESGKFLITNERQLQCVKKYLPKLATMISKKDKEQVRVEAELRQMVIKAESKKYDDRYGSKVLWIIEAIIALVVLESIKLGFLEWIALIVIGVAFYKTHYKTGLEWNYMNASEKTRKSGLQ